MNIRPLKLESGPQVAGVLSCFDQTGLLAGDLVEVRLDLAGHHAGWLKHCRAIAAEKPVLLTVRLRAEGGAWPADNDDRLILYQEALPVVSAVDVELASAIAAKVAAAAQAAGKTCVLSHHDFEKTPPLAELEAVIQRARALGGVPKLATMIQTDWDVDVLRQLLENRGGQPLCVIAMGEACRQTRVEFARLGSCLTYGYLDKPTAPGQMAAAELMKLVHG